MKNHFVSFMKNIFDSGHAEAAPPLEEGQECWYLPIFGVYHPKKPDQIRVVFDSSAQFKGISLNNVMLTGPDLTNSLLGLLTHFRKESIAVTADIQQMFHCFIVREDDRNYLRFLWYRNNNVDDRIVEYRMKVHVFGNSPSPAVATYGLRRTAQAGEGEFGEDAKRFVERDFYVDDALKSMPTASEAIDLLQRTQGMLANANLRLHKIASSSAEGIQHVGFILGKAKLAPQPEHTIPRLELCGAVLATEVAELILDELDVKLDAVKFYTDSKVVLGYINNQTKRFYTYISNRVERIRRSTQAEQWNYVPTDQNPADLATRSVPASLLKQTIWLTGPAFLLRRDGGPCTTKETFGLIEPESDKE
uniref:Uncharacterized protein LOC116940390 n=1 Tax=Petromyzon marinus TaxID=7757 RepID=A0AAJ7WQ85_PETMA|nr:uncharacterized protein LOC116940390 [Petromyzon marinus]